MNTKLMSFVVASACAVSLNALAQEAAEAAPAEENGLECEESKIWSAGVDVDFFSAYVWRNAVQNNQMVMQPGVWLDLEPVESLTLGAFLWQNYDLTNQRRSGYLKHALTETDYNVHADWKAWSTEEDEFALNLELGHDWYTYQGVRSDDKSGSPDTRELYLKATFANPLVDVYGQVSWMYRDFGDYKKGVSYELGLTKEVEVTDELTVGADWNVNFGNKNYLYFLYGGTPSGAYEHGDEEESDIYDDYASKRGGFGGTTLKLYSSYAITEWMSLKATIAYTGLLNQSLREATTDDDCAEDFYGDKYPNDFVWGGLSLNIAF